MRDHVLTSSRLALDRYKSLRTTIGASDDSFFLKSYIFVKTTIKKGTSISLKLGTKAKYQLGYHKIGTVLTKK